MRIQQLSPLLANQIAAGEVIERPASVVKELLENSLDAKASHVTIEIEKGGISRIKVTDNGLGIHPDDLYLAVSSHATSKIKTTDDLISITTLGFRGEALASIASISQLTLTSNTPHQEMGSQISVKGGKTEPVIFKMHPVGTTVDVQHLFFNTPARRKFLRSHLTEFSHIEEVVRRMALSHFDSAFTFMNENKMIFNLAPASEFSAKKQRVIKLFGRAFMDNAEWLDTSACGLRLWGWLGSPHFLRSTTDRQYFYINGRMVRDKLINHAVRKAFQDKLFEGRHPLYVLHLEIDPRECDVNVHPTKHEVRFHQTRWVHDFIYTRLRDVLKGSVTPLIFPEEKTYKEENHFIKKVEPQKNVPSITQEEIFERVGKIIGRYQKNYLITEKENGLLIIHIPSAQKIILERALEDLWSKKSLTPRALLFPERITLDEASLDTLQRYQTELKNMGILLERMAPNVIIIRELSERLDQKYLLPLLQALANGWKVDPKMKLSAAFIAEHAVPSDVLDFSLKQQLDLLEQISTLDRELFPLSMFCRFVKV